MRRGRWAGATLIALGLILWAIWRSAPERPVPAAVEAAPAATTPAPAGDAPVLPSPQAQAAGTPFSTLLLPDGGIEAVPASVELGLAFVSPEDAARHDALLNEAAAEARADDFEDLANVESWRAVPAVRQSDGAVRVGPVALPPADGVWVRARGSDGLRYYAHRVSPSAPPAAIRPLVGAGLRVTREAVDDSRVTVFLRRRGATPEGPAWQALQAAFAPDLLEAFGDTPMAVDASALLRPLEAQPIELQFWVNGIEAQRQTVILQPGAVQSIVLDAAAQSVAQDLAFDLELVLVDRDTQAPISDVQVEWAGDRGLLLKTSDTAGTVTFRDLDRRQAHRLTVLPAADDHDRPVYTNRLAVEVSAETDPVLSRPTPRLRKSVELTPLRWIEVEVPPGTAVAPPPSGTAYPIFVLQRQTEDGWRDQPADHFVPTGEGVAVSVDATGVYRVAMAVSPWQVHVTPAVTIDGPGARRVALDRPSMYNAQVQVLEHGVPLTDRSVFVRGALRGLPPAALQTDALGRITLADVTEPRVWVETDEAGEVVVDLASGGREARLADAP